MSLDYWLFTHKPYLVDGEDVGVMDIEQSDSYNITHNLTNMASKCVIKFNENGYLQKQISLYDLLWRPFDNGFTKNNKIYLKTLLKLYQELENNPEKYKQYEAENDWGTYHWLLNFVKNVVDLCMEHKDWYINISR